MLEQVADVAFLADRVLALHVEARRCRAARAARPRRTSCSSSAKKKSGIENPKYENDVASVVEHRVLADRAHHADRTGRASPTARARCPRAGTSSRWLRPPCRRPAAAVRNDVAPVALDEVAEPAARTARGRDSSRWYWCSRLRDRLLRDAPACAGAQRSGSPRAETRSEHHDRRQHDDRASRPAGAVRRTRSPHSCSSRSGRGDRGKRRRTALQPVYVQSSMFQVKPSCGRVVLQAGDGVAVPELGGLLEQRDRR